MIIFLLSTQLALISICNRKFGNNWTACSPVTYSYIASQLLGIGSKAVFLSS